MALAYRTLWEIRSGGNDLNGAGYYDRGGASADYTKQDAPELSLADLATPGAGSTTLTSATGGFTAAMVGNVWYIPASGNFVAGYYEMTAFTDGNTLTLDRSPTPGGAGAGGSGRLGGGRQTFTDAFLEGVSPGDTIWVESGTYTLAENLTILKDGTEVNGYISLKGYQTNRADGAQGSNRPLIEAGAFDFRTGDRFWVADLRINVTDTLSVSIGNYSVAKNIKVYQSTGTANRPALNIGQMGRAEDCELISPKGVGLQSSGYGPILRCYVHHCDVGIIAGSYSTVVDCIVAECINKGADMGSGANQTFNGCTVDHCVNGMEGTTPRELRILNCQISHCTDGVKLSSPKLTSSLDYNNFHGNTGNDVTNIEKGHNSSSDDPAYTDDAALSGSTATTSSSVLTQSGGDFSTVTDNRDFIQLISGAAIMTGHYLITAHTATTVTLDRDPNDSAAGNIVWRVRTGINFLPAAAAAGHGMAEVMANV